MALSNPVVLDTVQNEPVIGQHYLECCTEDCGKNCQFYCNPCHRPLCEKCRDEHQNSPATKNHEVVSYRQRKRQLPVEKCKDHPSKDIDIICEDCQVPLCSKCAMQDHRKHALNDLETIYSEGFTLCLNEIYKIHQYFLPTSQDIQKDVMKETTDIKTTINRIRTSMKAEAEILKSLVDTVTSDSIEQINKMEEALTEELQSQHNTYKDYISYLKDLVTEFHGYLSSIKLQNNPLIFSLVDRLNIQPIPETTKPVPPVFTAGQYSKKDVSKLLGRVTAPDIKPENREIKPMEMASTQLKPTEKQKKQDREKSDMKQTLSLSSSFTEVREYTVPGLSDVNHMSFGKPGRLWGSDHHGRLVQFDLQGNRIQMMQTGGGSEGYHTVTQNGDLIYTDKKKKVINRKTLDKATTNFIKTGDWEPISIHSSHINGDILVGMIKNKKAKVTRYNKTGEEIQNIQRDNKGQEMYEYPHYITENINGDICTSDLNKRAVVVVNKSGQYRFSYISQGSPFYPCGICTDLLGHILVCNSRFFGSLKADDRDAVHLLDQDGQLLSLLLTPKQGQGLKFFHSLCVDNENNLHVGQQYTTSVTVYKYLQ
ncbi:uncharacterized protein LOC128165251 [Crassostrea angulata]|uniref:uncharacterized protein LOC128165251 n=1 Tax=Magallana angulata TaxID=2784310 RepID=UPI0022B142E9|nr:uncharacterized protein LOC128165251 [Crassostrea angulata]XP_052685588.1 uncharacterized protein LOC128165251 [Crassostrea angulata]XP_052685589.1 uncharacterized protein LOC128165251 [Crassostrea angulata]